MGAASETTRTVGGAVDGIDHDGDVGVDLAALPRLFADDAYGRAILREVQSPLSTAGKRFVVVIFGAAVIECNEHVSPVIKLPACGHRMSHADHS